MAEPCKAKPVLLKYKLSSNMVKNIANIVVRLRNDKCSLLISIGTGKVV